jgi:hypothetical protein
VLKEAVYEKLKDMCDNKQDIIYEDYKINKELNLEWYQVIVRISFNSFRVYIGTLHSTKNITINYMTINNNMLEVMIKNILSTES